MNDPFHDAEKHVKKRVNDFIKDMDDPDKREEILKGVNGHTKFVLDPVLYAKDAIRCLEDQLTRVRSAKKKTILEKRVKDWKLRLEVLEGDETDIGDNND